MNNPDVIKQPETPATSAPASGSLPDWQIVTIISDTDYQEVNCNGGDHRRIRKAKCSCGQPVLIEFDSKQTCRRDKKRIFYPDQPDIAGLCVFRCKSCHEPIGDTCPDAAYGEVENADFREPAQ